MSVWGKQAEACNQYLKRGSAVLVEGRLQADKATGGPRTFEKKDGTTSAAFEVTAERIQFLSSGKHEGENDGDHQEAGAPAPAAEEENIPF